MIMNRIQTQKTKKKNKKMYGKRVQNVRVTEQVSFALGAYYYEVIPVFQSKL
jgi:hypothetical protein